MSWCHKHMVYTCTRTSIITRYSSVEFLPVFIRRCTASHIYERTSADGYSIDFFSTHVFNTPAVEFPLYDLYRSAVCSHKDCSSLLLQAYYSPKSEVPGKWGCLFSRSYELWARMKRKIKHTFLIIKLFSVSAYSENVQKPQQASVITSIEFTAKCIL